MPTTNGFATDLITFSRGSLATVTDSDGYIKWAPHNLLLASEQFDASAWAKSDVTISANLIAAPNGTTTADKIVEAATTAHHFINQNDKLSDYTVPHTFGVYAKVGERQYLNLSFQWTTDYIAATFDLSSGTVTSTRAGGSGSGQTATITSVGGGWYLCTLNGIYGAAGSNATVITISNTGTPTGPYGNAYLGVSGNGLYTWGAHLYRSDLGGMQANASAYPYYNPSTPKNLLGYSEAFDNAAWTKDSASVTANAVASPNGTITADKLVESAANAVHYTYQLINYNAALYTLSAYLKKGERNFAVLYIFSAATAQAFFDLENGTVGTVSGSGSPSATIVSVGNGWYRCAITATPSAGNGGAGIILASANGTISYTGDGTSGVYLWGAQLSDSASLDPYVGSYGAAPSAAAAYGPRLDYDPSTLAAKGLLVEEQRTNLVTYSDQLSNVAWTKNGTTVTADAVVGPDGVFSMDKIVATAANVQHNILMPSIANGSAVYTYSFYAKKAEETVCVVDFGGVSTITATFNLDTGTVVSSTGVVASIISAGNGIYRCIATTSTAVDPSAGYRPFIAPRQFTAYAGDGTSGIYIYGAQLEAASFATSYIPTAAATVTRNADVAFVATSQFPYSATEGTLVLAADVLATTSANRFGALLSSPSNFIGVGNNIGGSGGVYAEFFVSISGVTQAYLAFNNAVAANTLFKVAGSYKADDFAASANGATALTDTTGSVPTDIDTLQIGRYYSSSYFNGHIRQITYIPRRLTNAELIARST